MEAEDGLTVVAASNLHQWYFRPKTPKKLPIWTGQSRASTAATAKKKPLTLCGRVGPVAAGTSSGWGALNLSDEVMP
jgi:hypothetical protein